MVDYRVLFRENALELSSPRGIIVVAWRKGGSYLCMLCLLNGKVESLSQKSSLLDHIDECHSGSDGKGGLFEFIIEKTENTNLSKDFIA